MDNRKNKKIKRPKKSVPPLLALSVNTPKYATLADVARACKCTPQNVAWAVGNGKLTRSDNGLIDLNDPNNIEWIESHGGDVLQVNTVDTRPTNEKPLTDRTTGELQKEKLRLQAVKLQLDIDEKRKTLLQTSFVTNNLFGWLAKLNTNVERTAAVSIQEYGLKILSDGEVTPKTINDFTNEFLACIHRTKLQVIKEMESYEPK